MVRQAVIWIGLLAVVAMAGFAAYVRLAPSDPAMWHVDPLTVEPPATPNFVLRRPGEDAPVFPMPPGEAMAEFNAIALATPRLEILAGSPEDGFVTYIARSALWGFPDYISVKALPAEGGTRFAVYSRARFGYSDMGVNAARIDAWFDQLAREAPPA